MDFIIDGIEYTTINALAKVFGISYGAVMRNLEFCEIEFIHRNNRKYIKKSVFEKAFEESKRIIGFREIVEEMAEKFNSELNSKSYLHLNKLITYISGNNYFGVSIIVRPIFKIYDSLNFYIYIEDKMTLEEGIKEYLLLYKKPFDVKIYILCDDSSFGNKKETVELIKEYIDYIDKKTLCSYVEVVNFLRLTLVKNLSSYTNEEISDYITIASQEMTKAGCKNLIGLCKYIQDKVVCKNNIIFQYNNDAREKMETTPYDTERYLKLAYMVFNEEYWEEHNMIQKAVKNERYAKVWLYHAMHYVCDWRKEDIFGRIPRIELNTPPKQVLEDIESGVFTKKQYKLISDRIAMKVNYNPKKPNKTKYISNAPPLRLYIPESFSPVIGMLALACEAHNQKKGNKDALCYLKGIDLYNCIKVFGDEYKDLFGGYVMSNRRANKSHMTMISDTGNELDTDGYLLASFARSHTGGINRIPDVTSRYLQAKMDGYTVDEITITLFERGVCSFVPYLLCSVLRKDEFEKSGIKEQTAIMNNLPMKAYDIENLLKIDDILVTKIKQMIGEIIKWSNEDNLSELIRAALESIIKGECIGKNDAVYCLRKACGKECSDRYRETCIGCGYEMYVRAFLMELHNEIEFQKDSLDRARTQAEKIKRAAILEKKIYPSVYELLTAIKYIYRQDIEDYKKLLLGDDENGIGYIGK